MPKTNLWATGVSKVFPGKRRLKLSQGETEYFRWTQFGIQSLRGCFFLLFGSTLVVKIKKTQESTPSISVMPKKNNRDKENTILPIFTTGRLGPLVGSGEEQTVVGCMEPAL
jgi:hypothetical protein